MLSPQQLSKIADQASGDLLKGNFREYFKSFAFRHLSPSVRYQHSWSIDCMAEYAMACFNKDIKRLVVNIPPRQGKSMIWSCALPSFTLGHRPQEKIFSISNKLDLSSRDVTATKKLLNTIEYNSMFPKTKIAKDTEEYFTTTLGGERKAFSSTGQITGQGANCLILDDFMSVVMYDSDAERNRALRFFFNGIENRLNNEIEDIIIVVEQRLGIDDLSGNLLGSSKKWEHLCLPAEFQEKKHFYMGNFSKTVEEGEILNPERLPKSLLDEKRNARVISFEDGNERANSSQYFQSQYLQNPISLEGNLIDLKWFKEFDLEQKYKMDFDSVIASTDAAAKTKKTNDPSAFLKCGIIGNDIYVLDVYNKRKEYHETKQNLILFASNFPMVNDIIIEDASTGQVLITELKRESKFGIRAVTTKGLSKEIRARNETGQMANGNIYFPKNAPWLAEFKNQLLMFPNGKHDDMVDAFVYCLQHIRENQSVNYDDLFSFF
tara:strand:+ start:35485 stop:36960 length:1476 start_codon:yes stop_codon:yes gene_type:complete